MKAFICTFMTLALVFSMTACSSRKSETPSSSAEPSSSFESSSAPPVSSIAPSSEPSSSMSKPEIVEDIESGASNLKSNVESMVTPTMSTDFDKIGALDAAQVKWGPGVQVDEQNRTVGSEMMQEQYGRFDAYFIAPEDCGKLYLTFDEGYENGYTPQILDVLKEKQVSAVFFVTLPFVKSEPELIQRMIDEGHVVGNHTSHHWNPTQKSLDEAAQDIKELHDYMKDTFDYEMSLYRPPEGAFSEQTLAMVQQMGYTTALWSFAYADWDPNNQMGYDKALERTCRFIHEGGIYLLHAVSKDNAGILGELIDNIRDKGLTVSKWDLS